MNSTEKAIEYSKGKALDTFDSLVKQAYSDGYEEGYRDAIEYCKNEKRKIIEGGVEYIDMGLPSGTLWSNGYVTVGENRKIGLFPYVEAEIYNIPTPQQYAELYKNCKLLYKEVNFKEILKQEGVHFVARNGEKIYLPFFEHDFLHLDNHFEFWLQSDGLELKENNKAIATDKYANKITGECFMGIGLPLLLVKTLDKQ